MYKTIHGQHKCNGASIWYAITESADAVKRKGAAGVSRGRSKEGDGWMSRASALRNFEYLRSAAGATPPFLGYRAGESLSFWLNDCSFLIRIVFCRYLSHAADIQRLFQTAPLRRRPLPYIDREE